MGGWHSTEVAFALHTRPSQVRFLAFPNFFRDNFSREIVDVAKVYQRRCCLEEWTAVA